MSAIRQVGIIDIGSSAIRLVVMEINPDATFRRLDRASKPINLGRDVFVNRVLGRETLQQAIMILDGFCEVLRAYGVDRSQVYAVATSAIREARNRDVFLDRVLVKTGLKVRIVDGVEENHLTYIAVLHALGEAQQAFSKGSSMIIEIGGGSTELMIMDRGKMVASHLYRMGTLRYELETPQEGGWLHHHHDMEDHFRSTLENIKAEFSLGRVRHFVMVGGDARTAAHHCGIKAGDHHAVIPRESFLDFVRQISGYSNEDCVKRLNITYYEAESLIPALQGYRAFLEETAATELIVPDVSIREGVLLRFALGYDERTQRQYEAQVLASALSLARKYHVDEDHGVYVQKVANTIFSYLQEDYGLTERERLYLQIASLLHDIGNHIRSEGHHRHGAYIVANSEIFGLGSDDLPLISQVVRYHRSHKPELDHHDYAILSREGRLSVIKCAAILRLAEALDRSHSQRIRLEGLRIVGDELQLLTDYQGDISLERTALRHKDDLFEDVYGLRVALVNG